MVSLDDILSWDTPSCKTGVLQARGPRVETPYALPNESLVVEAHLTKERCLTCILTTRSRADQDSPSGGRLRGRLDLYCILNSEKVAAQRQGGSVGL